ncbi:maleylpyruvate isomerase family mycothiol-dependent enzyme [Kitasatospora sp. NPDC057223]|uniref:maleylpyruvate isomerase family mycothiol-dependent enzyme n=1 Tax=Kitasatospora sp. NPDC057223 TaxID=3346055 RepID=UPI003641252F
MSDTEPTARTGAGAGAEAGPGTGANAATSAGTGTARAAAGLRLVADATAHLLRSVAELPPEAVAGPSALPGWTRGHVLTHLARNADSLVNLLDGARTGRDIPQYATPEARDQDIEDGAPRPLDLQLADLHESAERFTMAAAALDDAAWGAEVRHRAGYVFGAFEIPWRRLVEVEYHHVDLDAGYTPAHWPERFAVVEFHRLTAALDSRAGLPALLLVSDDTADRAHTGTAHVTPGTPATPDGAAGDDTALTVEGPVRALTAWLSGRSDGDGLQVHRAGVQLADARTALPKLPPMG